MNTATSPTGWARNPDGSPGYTWNPLSGCLNHTPEGLCLGGLFPCYAYKLANGRVKPLYLANKNVATTLTGSDLMEVSDMLRDPFYPRFWKDRLNEPLGDWHTGYNYRYHKPKGIFVCDMSDLFGIGIPQGWTDKVLGVIRSSPTDRFYILTKQAQRLPEFSPFPDNCWVGVTCTNQTMVLEATNHLYNHRIAKTQFLSIEPLLSWDTSHFSRPLTDSISKLDIDWLIIGACTGTLPDMTLLGERYPDLWLAGHGNKITAQPRIEWVREIVEAADKANVKVFLKDNLKPLLENEPLDPLYWANVCNDEAGNERVDDSLRQETPEKRIKEEVN